MSSEVLDTIPSLFYGAHAIGLGCEQDSANIGSHRTRTLTGRCHSAGVGEGAPVEYLGQLRKISGLMAEVTPGKHLPDPGPYKNQVIFLFLFCEENRIVRSDDRSNQASAIMRTRGCT